MRRGGIGGALLILLLATSAVGYTLLDLGMGSQVFQGSAKSGGMGEVFQLTESTPLSLALNPSLLARSDKLNVTASYRFAMVEEEWALPVHDSFDALLGYETYSSNQNVYHNSDLSFSTGAIPRAANLAFAIGYMPAYDFNYNFHQEVRDRNSQAEPLDKVVADAYVESDGSIRSVTIGGAGGYGERFYVGLSVDYLFGSYDMDVRLANMNADKLPCWESAPGETADVFSASDLSGARFRVGATYVVSKRVELAATYTGEAELDGKYTASDGFGAYSPWQSADGESFKLKYPASLDRRFIIIGNANNFRVCSKGRISGDKTCLSTATAGAVHDVIELNVMLSTLALKFDRTSHVSKTTEPVFRGTTWNQIRLMA